MLRYRPDLSLLPRLASPSCRWYLGGRHSDGMLLWLRMLLLADQPLLRPWSAGNGGAAALASMAPAVPPMLGRAGAISQRAVGLCLIHRRGGNQIKEKRRPPCPPVGGGWQPHPFLSMLVTRVQAQPLLPLHPFDRLARHHLKLGRGP